MRPLRQQSTYVEENSIREQSKPVGMPGLGSQSNPCPLHPGLKKERAGVKADHLAFENALTVETKVLRNSIELVIYLLVVYLANNIPSNITGHLNAEHIISGYLTDLNEK